MLNLREAVSKRRGSFAVATLVSVAVFVPLNFWVSRNIRERAQLNRILSETRTLCAQAQPDVGPIAMTVSRLKAFRPGSGSARVWSVQITDDSGRFVGATIWKTEPPVLISASWRQLPAPQFGYERLSDSEVLDLARMRLAQMRAPVSPDGWRIVGKPERYSLFESVWCQSGNVSYHIRLDKAGRLLTLDRLLTPQELQGRNS